MLVYTPHESTCTFAWTLGGWPACAALVAAMLVIMAAIVVFAWSDRPPGKAEPDRTAVS